MIFLICDGMMRIRHLLSTAMQPGVQQFSSQIYDLEPACISWGSAAWLGFTLNSCIVTVFFHRILTLRQHQEKWSPVLAREIQARDRTHGGIIHRSAGDACKCALSLKLRNTNSVFEHQPPLFTGSRKSFAVSWDRLGQALEKQRKYHLNCHRGVIKTHWVAVFRLSFERETLDKAYGMALSLTVEQECSNNGKHFLGRKPTTVWQGWSLKPSRTWNGWGGNGMTTWPRWCFTVGMNSAWRAAELHNYWAGLSAMQFCSSDFASRKRSLENIHWQLCRWVIQANLSYFEIFCCWCCITIH